MAMILAICEEMLSGYVKHGSIGWFQMFNFLFYFYFTLLDFKKMLFEEYQNNVRMRKR